jgi:hypothetical protein
LKFYEHLGDLYRRAFLYGGPGGQCDNWYIIAFKTLFNKRP